MKKLFILMVVLGLTSIGMTAEATQFMNITFNGDAIGSAPTTTPVGMPISKPNGIGGYSSAGYSSPPTDLNGAILVDSVAGMNKAAVMTSASDNPILGALWLDTGFSQTSPYIGLTFDISVLAAPPSLTVQQKFLNDSQTKLGILFGMNVFGWNGASSTPSVLFAVAPTNEDGGVFALRDTTNTRLMTFGTYTEGEKYNIGLFANYQAGTVDAYVNGALAMSAHPLFSAPATTTEFFFYLNGESGYANQVALDNINGYNAPVPVPGALLLLGPGLAGLAMARRRFGK